MTPDGFSAEYRVRFDEAGPDGRLRTSGLLRYTQDLAAQHSEALGYDRAWYVDRGLTWLVRTAELDVLGPIPYGAALIGTTRVLGFRRAWSRRESTFRLGEDLVATVRIDWVLIDHRGAPARIPAEFESIFQATRGPDAAGRLKLARVDLSQHGSSEVARLEIDVRPADLDPLDHVNNAVYADWLDRAVLAADDRTGGADVGRLPRRVRLEYALPAGPGEVLEAQAWRDPDGWSCRVVRTTDTAELLRARLEPGAGSEEDAG